MKINCKIKEIIFLFMLILFISPNNVYARILSISDITDEFKSFFNEVDENGESDVSISIDEKNNKIIVYYYSGNNITLNYTNEYIEYNNRDSIVTPETAMNNMIDSIIMIGITQAIINLSGYEDKIIEYESYLDFTNSYDLYGIQIETEEYKFEESDENSSWSESGDFFKYFKISRDTDKIDAFINKYGVDDDAQVNQDTSFSISIEAKNITSNSVVLQPKITFFNNDSEKEVFCYIYRSTSENGIYEKISDEAVNCVGGVGLKDEGLNSNSTYYYKVMMGDVFSNPIEVKTRPQDESLNSSTSNISDNNPYTGTIVPVFMVIVLVIGSILILINTRKQLAIKKV